MGEIKISPSLLSVDIGNMERDVKKVLISKEAKLLSCIDKQSWINEICKIEERKNELLEIAHKFKREEQKEQFNQIIKYDI